MRLLKYFPFVFLISDACVEPLDLAPASSAPRIVVDGLLTDKPGNHIVRLFQTSPVNELDQPPDPVMHARVAIVDDSGLLTPLVETEPGQYEITSSTFFAKRGVKYKLVFTTADGSAFESSEQEISPAGQIDSLYAELIKDAINPDDPFLIHDVFRIYIDSHGEPNAPNLFRWRWRSIFEAQTFPGSNYYLDTSEDTSVKVPDPLPCSGVVVMPDGDLFQQTECICCSCWVDEYSNNAMVSTPRLAAGAKFNRVMVAQIPLDPKKFQVKYFIKVEQLTLSEEIYDFWRNLQAQQGSAQSIFQPNVTRVKGNIKSTDGSKEEVSGVFSVASITTKELFIRRRDIPFHMPIDSVYKDCRIAYPGSTNQKPLFW